MKRKITIIGAGAVGATIAYRLAALEQAAEVVLIDVNEKKVLGEVMDIAQSTSFSENPVVIKGGGYGEAAGSDIVVITSGLPRKEGQTRLELTQTNLDILKDITPKIVAEAPDAKYIIVSNPVDILTYVFTKISGLKESQVIGTGTLLDTARLRCGLSQKLNVSQGNIHAYVFGEHGDTSFIPWSSAYISGVSLDEYTKIMANLGKPIATVDRDAMTEYVKKSGGQIIANKGATFYAIAAAVSDLCGILLAANNCVATVSSMMHGEYGIEDVCLSTLTLIGPDGIHGKIPMRIAPREIEELRYSADTLKKIIAQIKY